MKRSPRTVFDDSGQKWYQSPMYKEVKMDHLNPDITFPLREEYGDNSKLIRDRFYDFFNRVTRMGEPRIDVEELSKSLTVKVDELPDSAKISEIFERLNSKVAMNSKGKKNWSEEETSFFIWIIINYSEINKTDFQDLSDSDWDYIASVFPGKKADQCKVRWQSLLKINLSRAPWTQKEDDILSQIIEEKGPKKWKEIAIELNERAGNSKFFRQGKQCRERWINHLDPAINRGSWTHYEDCLLLQAHIECGKKWAEIAKRLKTRTENSVKNRFNSLIKKYRADGMDADTVSTTSAFSNGSNSLEDLERRVSQMILDEKKKEMSNMPTPQHIPELSDEEYLSDNDPTLDSTAKIEEGTYRSYQSGQNKKKSGSLFDVNKSKNTLKEFVTQEIDYKQQSNSQTQRSQSASTMVSNPLFPQGISQIQTGLFNSNTAGLFGNSQSRTTKVEASPNLFRSGSNSATIGNLFGLSNDMANNIWMVPNNQFQNLVDQSPQMIGSQQQPTGQIQTVSAYLDNEEQKQPQVQVQSQTQDKVYNLVERPNEEFTTGDFQDLHYAIVDIKNSSVFFISPVNKDNFPPNFIPATPGQPQNRSKVSMNNTVDMVMASPALGNVNFSPNIFGNNLNNNLINLVKNQLSPGVNFFQESPGGFYNPDQRNLGNWSTEWTPETSSRTFNRTDSANLRPSNLLWGGAQQMQSSPGQRFGFNESAFLKKQTERVMRQMQGQDGMKMESPTSFLGGDASKNPMVSK